VRASILESRNVRLSIDHIRFATYRRVSLTLAALFVVMPVLVWTAPRRLPEGTLLLSLIAYTVLLVVLMMFNRNAECPSCRARLGISVPFRGACQPCGTRLEIVEV